MVLRKTSFTFVQFKNHPTTESNKDIRYKTRCQTKDNNTSKLDTINNREIAVAAEIPTRTTLQQTLTKITL